MIYNTKLDDILVNEVFKNKAVSYNELYRNVCMHYKKVARESFNSHIKKMTENGLIQKDDSMERGRRVYYSLTKKAIQETRLKILRKKTRGEKHVLEIMTQEERMVKLYMILFWMQNTARIEILDTDEELEKSLSQINMSKADLVIQDRTSVEGEYYNTRYKAISGALHIEKHEKGTPEDNKLLRYFYWLEGSSINDTLECLKNKNDPLTHIGFTQIEIEEAFKLLNDEGLIKPFAVYAGEVRYLISDSSLRFLIGMYSSLLLHSNDKLYLLHTCIRRSTPEERRWLEEIWGRAAVNQELINRYHRRHSIANNKRRRDLSIQRAKDDIQAIEKKSKEVVRRIKNECKDTIENYKFPSETLIDLFYPKFLRTDLNRSLY